MAATRSPDESLGSIFAALAANTAIATAKGTAAALTGSPALLAETLHTVGDAGNEVLLYVAVRRSRRRADSTHPFGYGPSGTTGHCSRRSGCSSSAARCRSGTASGRS
jgi:divalent metal cation (Fe/Co/Zn/Cd) transporter